MDLYLLIFSFINNIIIIIYKDTYILLDYYLIINLEIKLFLRNKFLNHESNKYNRFINHLLKYSKFVLSENNKNFNSKDVFINEFLLYRIKKFLNKKIAFFHIRTKKPELIKEVFSFKSLLEDFTSSALDLFNSHNVSEIRCITHNSIIDEKAYNKILKKRFNSLNLKTDFKDYSMQYLCWIYSEYLLIYGYDFLLTKEGYEKLIKVNKVVIFTIKK